MEIIGYDGTGGIIFEINEERMTAPPDPNNYHFRKIQEMLDAGATIPDAPEPIYTATRVQVSLALHAMGFPGGLNNSGVIAAAVAAGGEAEIMRAEAQEFRSDNPLMLALGEALGIEDVSAAVEAASKL